MSAYQEAGKCNEWYTPAYIFDALGERFDLDVAAPNGGPRHVPAVQYFSSMALDRRWEGFVWMNPPFGGQATKRAWLAKFFDHGNGIGLLPDRTSAPWFQEYMPRASMMLFVSPKIKFERKDGSTGDSPGDGTVLFSCGDRGASALRRASSLGFVCLPIDVMHEVQRADKAT